MMSTFQTVDHLPIVHTHNLALLSCIRSGISVTFFSRILFRSCEKSRFEWECVSHQQEVFTDYVLFLVCFLMATLTFDSRVKVHAGCLSLAWSLVVCLTTFTWYYSPTVSILTYGWSLNVWTFWLQKSSKMSGNFRIACCLLGWLNELHVCHV